MDITIYHNPRCGTSRNTLAAIREAGHEPSVVEYLANPPTREQLARLIADAGLQPRDAVRRKEAVVFIGWVSTGRRWMTRPCSMRWPHTRS